MKCANCGAEIALEDKSCSKCGAPRPQLSPSFAQAERRFATLRASYQAGTVDDATYQAALQNLVVQDQAGGHWMLGADDGEWYWHDGQQWVRRDPPPERPQARQVPPRPATLPEHPQTRPASPPAAARPGKSSPGSGSRRAVADCSSSRSSLPWAPWSFRSCSRPVSRRRSRLPLPWHPPPHRRSCRCSHQG